MKIVLATGIYPPDIGGPATYVRALAEDLVTKEMEVVVITYRGGGNQEQEASGPTFATQASVGRQWSVVRVEKNGGPLRRWRRYAKALREHGRDADAVIAFSSVSCGVPLVMAKLRKPKKILRLGGDFLWERYTDRGGRRTLREWYAKKWSVVSGQRAGRWLMEKLLRIFDHVVFSTKFQETLYEEFYRELPKHSVIENALPHGEPTIHAIHTPMRLLFMGRFVGFKNLEHLLRAVALQQSQAMRTKVSISFVGEGPMETQLRKLVHSLKIGKAVQFLPPLHGEEKLRAFRENDLLLLPSITEISPNVALEARSQGLPVLLSRETGLSDLLTQGMIVRDLRTPEEISRAIQEVTHLYEQFAADAGKSTPERGWGVVAGEWVELLDEIGGGK